MSLLRLLATGKSLVGMPDTNSRYRMRTRNLLPKFGSAKNPFAPPTPDLESPGAPHTSSPAKLQTASLFESPIREPEHREAAPIEAAKPAPKKELKTAPQSSAAPVAPAKVEARMPVAPAPSAPSGKPGKIGGWIKKLNPLALLPPRRGDSGRGRPARKPVQTELTLEKVRVVRNDLSDTDLEIVPGRLMGLPSGASPILPHTGNSGPGAWSRLTTKILGAQHAQIR
jgi:hypothetical protein